MCIRDRTLGISYGPKANPEKRYMMRTYSRVTAREDLVRNVFQWVTNRAWAQALDVVNETTTGRKFREWQEQAYRDISTFGQRMGRRAAPSNYESWVRNSLTMSTGNARAGIDPKPYGDIGSQERFVEQLGEPYHYQPKPYLWMYGVGGKGPR